MNFTFIITVVLNFLQFLHVTVVYCPKIAERVLIFLTLCHKINVIVITEVPHAVEALARNYAGEDLVPSLTL